MLVVNTNLWWTLAGLFAALTVGTFVRLVALRKADSELTKSRMSSLTTWWVLAIAFTLAVLGGSIGIGTLLGIAAIFSLREYIQLVGWKAVGRPTALIVFSMVPVYYLLILFGYGKYVHELSPIAFLLVVGGSRACLGLIDGYIRTTAAMYFGLMLFVYGLSHAYFLVERSSAIEPSVGSVGWFLYLVILTEVNDIAQAIVGRRFGRTKITPRISPNKSLEGLAGGVFITMIVATVLAPWLTTFSYNATWRGLGYTILSAILISTVGFLGDINMSGVKRDVGVKDGSKLLPGQGGMIDRIDSLTFTAPAFYYLSIFATDMMGTAS